MTLAAGLTDVVVREDLGDNVCGGSEGKFRF